MAFFPHVKKGDAFQPSALLENNIRDVVNGYNAIGARVTKGVANSSLRVPVWNASKEELPAGSAVTVDMTNEEDSPTGILPCVPFDGSCQTWGILPTALQPGSVGDCIIGGVSLIQMSGKGKVGDCVAPVFKDGKAAKDFVTVPTSPAKLLYANGKIGMVHFSEPGYHGYFK